jgi:aminomethyltransferase
MNATMTQALRLPLHERHARLGAKFMEFAGWEVPIQYTTIVEEHQAVRQKAGLFDVSHMGKFRVRGARSRDFLDRVLSNGLHKIGDGRALYSLLLNERGGVVDDVIVYQAAAEHFFMIVNAATRSKDFDWLQGRLPAGVSLEDESGESTILAVQGPASGSILAAVFGRDFKSLRPFHFMTVKDGGADLMIAATGYTGERGFEIVGSVASAGRVMDRILETGIPLGLRPAGFGARDTLRLESGLLLYGQDMDDETTPLEAGLEWVVDFTKDFVGKAALLSQKERGLSRRLAGFELTGPGVARHGYPIVRGTEVLGLVASGTYSPTLSKAIGLAYLPADRTAEGLSLGVRIRDREVPCRIVKLPFYRAERKA